MELQGKKEVTHKKLAHVQVYEALYKMVEDGTFPVGSRLPAEPKLAKMLGVSRMTLRQALDLLHDDGKLRKVRGAGNFVADGNKIVSSSLEKLTHPMAGCMGEEFDRTTFELKIEPSNDYEKELLNLDTPVIVAIHIWYWKGTELTGYTFGVRSPHTVTKYQLDLNKKEEVVRFAQTEIYEKAERSQLRIHPNSAGTSILTEYMKEGEQMTMVQEKIYDEELQPILCNKHYMLKDKAVFEINTHK